MKIKIEVDSSLRGMEAIISASTWDKVRETYSDIGNLPKAGDVIIGYPFLKCYVIRVKNSDIKKDALIISKGVKDLFYKDTDVINVE